MDDLHGDAVLRFPFFGRARRVQLFDFEGLGCSPNKQKSIGVYTDAQLATIYY